jgi:hypothetical protein
MEAGISPSHAIPSPLKDEEYDWLKAARRVRCGKKRQSQNKATEAFTANIPPYMRRVVVVGLLLLVSIVFVMPGVTLPRTTLQAQQMADQVFWLLATALPEMLACFAGPPQLLKQDLSAIISTAPQVRPAAPTVLIC